MFKIIILLFVIAMQPSLFAQGVKIGGTGNPDGNAILELDGSNGKGFLLPRLTDTQMNILNATDGMLIYNSTQAALYLRTNSSWQKLADQNNGGGFTLPFTASQDVSNGYVMELTNTSVTGINGGIKGSSSTSGYGLYGSSFTGIGGYFTSSLGPSLVTGNGNVGIGTAAPAAKLHARWNSPELLQLENTNALNPGINVRTFFKTGSFFTGAIGTTGTGSLAARMSFFTGVASTSAALTEKMSILSNGYVGINTINPVSRLEVNGKTLLRPGGDNAAVEITGNIRVSGSNSPAFMVTCPADGSSFEIDHPSCNGDPNALLFITAASVGYANYSVEYNAGTQKWKIITYGYMLMGKFTYNLKDCNDNCTPVYAAYAAAAIIFKDQKFNVLVIKR